MANSDWINRKEAAKHLTALGYPIAPRTLERLAADKKGPPYRRFQWRVVVYLKSDLESWAKSQTYEFRPQAA